MSYQNVFVGREEEQELLGELLNTAKGGSGVSAFITGPAGIGKTYLVENFFSKNTGIRVLQARCSEEDQPYEIIVKLLRKYTELDSNQLYGGETKAYSAVAKECKSIEKSLISPDKKGSSGQQMLFSSVRNVLSSIAKNTPLVVFADNLHMADHSSMDFVLSLVATMDENSLFFIGSYREEEVPDGHPLRSIKVDDAKIHQIFLEPLSALDVLELAEQMFGVADMPTLFIKRLYKETGGNPLFTREVVRAIMEDTAIDRNEPYWYTKIDLGTMSLPSSLKDIVISRVKRLDQESKTALQYGSAVGQTFSGPIVEKAVQADLGTPVSKTKNILSTLSEKKLLRAEEGMWKFEYPELRDLLYSKIGDKKNMHLTIANTMESEGADVYSIAKQYSLAGNDEKAWRYEEKAGDQALLAMAPLEAEKHFSRALEAMEHTLSKSKTKMLAEECIRLYVKHGDAAHSLGEVDLALESYDVALALSKKAKNDILFADVSGKRGDAYRTRSQWDKAKKEYTNSLAIGEKKGDKHIMAHGLRGLGYLDWRRGEFESAIERYSDALKYAEETKDITLVGIILIEFGNVYNEKGELDKALRYYLKSVDILTKARDFFELARAYNNIGDTYLQMRQWDNAVSFFKKTGAVAEKIGNKSMMGWALFNAAEALAKGGDPDKALNYAEGSLRILEKIGDSIGLSGVYKGYGIAYKMKKDWKNAEECFTKSRELGENANSPYTLGEILLETGAFYKDMGDMEKAGDCLQRAEDIGKEIGAKVLIARIEAEKRRKA